MSAFGEIAIGIDLGTTYSCVGVWQNDCVEIIANEVGNRTTPSMVSFTDESYLVGEASKVQENFNPANTIYGIKRLMGRQRNDSIVDNLQQNWPFQVVSGKNGKAAVQVQYKGETKVFLPEEISSMILIKMKEIAETYLGGQPVRHAVITVPAYFNVTQRQATKDAGKISGLNVMRIISEPTAAAIAYGLGQRNSNKKILVFDFGGGTLDVSLLKVNNDDFGVIATAGDSNLGGEDIDNNIALFLAEEFKKKHSKTIEPNSSAFKRLKNAGERAKRTLSMTTTASIEFDSLEGNNFVLKPALSRAKFEEINHELFERCMIPVNQVLKDGKVTKNQVDDIVLVGGSSRIPYIQNRLKEYFGNRQLNKSINPDEAIAYGATVQAAILAGTSEALSDVLLVDVTPLSLGTDITGGRMSVIIPRNSSIPVRFTQSYTTSEDDQTSVRVEVYEGERELLVDNYKLAEFTVRGLRPMPRGQASIQVTFEIDTNGLLTVYAIEKTSGAKGKITVSTKNRALSEEDIQRIIQDAEVHRTEDLNTRLKLEAMFLLEDMVYNIKHALVGRQVSASNKAGVEGLIEETTHWIQANRDANVSLIIEKREDVRRVGNNLIPNLFLGRDENYGQFPERERRTGGDEESKRAGGGGANDID